VGGGVFLDVRGLGRCCSWGFAVGSIGTKAKGEKDHARGLGKPSTKM